MRIYIYKLDENKSALVEHSIKQNHTIDWDKAKLLHHEPTYYKRMTKLAIEIKKHPFSFNFKQDMDHGTGKTQEGGHYTQRKIQE